MGQNPTTTSVSVFIILCSLWTEIPNTDRGKGEQANFGDSFKATDHHGGEENLVGAALTVVVGT